MDPRRPLPLVRLSPVLALVLACGDGQADDAGDDPALRVDVMVGTGDFLIDATEVRIFAYAKFLSATTEVPTLPEVCWWKTGHEPDNWVGQLQDNLNEPVRGLDWCDAWAYCEWAGKHLCGRVGGVPAGLDEAVNFGANEWFRACTNDGATITFPYGETYEPSTCNSDDFDAGILGVGELTTCEGGYPGLFDISGNVWEWTSACGDNEDVSNEEQLCRRRGGSFASSENSMRCISDNQRARNFRASSTGVRCCATADFEWEQPDEDEDEDEDD